VALRQPGRRREGWLPPARPQQLQQAPAHRVGRHPMAVDRQPILEAWRLHVGQGVQPVLHLHHVPTRSVTDDARPGYAPQRLLVRVREHLCRDAQAAGNVVGADVAAAVESEHGRGFRGRLATPGCSRDQIRKRWVRRGIAPLEAKIEALPRKAQGKPDHAANGTAQSIQRSGDNSRT
jgi:hypothetical protein